jgi:hypothetical protein
MVGFPVAEPTFASDDLQALRNAAATCELTAPVIAAVAFAPLFLAAQVAKEGAALALVRVDVLIDALMANGGLSLQAEAARDLFRTPLVAQEALDLLPLGRWDVWAGALLLAGLSLLISLLRAIAARALIAPEFARDGGFMHSQVVGYRTLAVLLFAQGINLVSLFAGQLLIAQLMLL